MNESSGNNPLLVFLTTPWMPAALMLILQVATAAHYGYFGDELYYLACARHLAFGYVDHPPVVAWLLWVWTALFGQSVVSLRVCSGLAGAGLVFMTHALACRLGAKLFARGWAAWTVLLAAAFPGICSFYSMNPFDILLVSACFYVVLGILQGEPSLLSTLVLGLLGGLACLTKYSALVMAAGLFVGMLSTRRGRAWLCQPWPYFAASLALFMFAPHIYWQVIHDFPTLIFMRNVLIYKNMQMSPVGLAAQLGLALNPVLLPMLIGGLVYLLKPRPPNKPAYRLVGIAVAFFMAVYLLQRSKFYYLLPVTPMLLAAGAVWLERNTALRLRLRMAYVSLAVVTGLVMLPLIVPLLPLETFRAYSRALPIWGALKMEKHEQYTDLPILFLFRFGWPDVVVQAAENYAALPQQDRARCAILTGDYGTAGALDLWGAEKGLPAPICLHNTYWIWGPREYTGDMVLTIGLDRDRLQKVFSRVDDVPAVAPMKMYYCRKLKQPMAEVWQQSRLFH